MLPKLIRKNSEIEGYGVFAAEAIPKGIPVVEYRGRKLSKKQGDQSNSKFIFILDRRTDVLGQNLAKYINHSCNPNCEAEIVDDEIWINSIRPIAPGEEITYNYGYAWDDDPFPCLCSTDDCVGYMLDKTAWPKLFKSGLVPAT